MKTGLKPLPVTAAAIHPQVKLVIVGHVDHGKSTLIGRLIHDTDSLPDGREEEIRTRCKQRGMPFEWSFLMDALQTERDQGVTIDTTQIWLRLPERDVVIIDAPGHREFVKNMVTGAAQSDAALLLIDAEEGMREQTRRHAFLLHLLGIPQVAVVINKMDKVNYSEETFHRIVKECTDYLSGFGIAATAYIPVSARDGDMIATRAKSLDWYKGPTVLETLSHISPQKQGEQLPLRFPVQDVYKFDDRRIIVGRVESGVLHVGDDILLSPTNQKATVKSIEVWPPREKLSATAGEVVGITLADQRFVERGNIISHADHAPMLSNMLRGRIFWLGHVPLELHRRYKMRIATSEYLVEVKEIERIIDTDTLAETPSNKVERLQVAEVMFHVRGLAVLDAHEHHPQMGRFVLVEDYDIVGGGIIDMEGLADQRVSGRLPIKSENVTTMDLKIRPEQRAEMNGHWGGIMWFTGLSGSGKSTLALELQQRLFAKGYQVYVLDGDNMRQGLCSDLGFSPEDRSENIRRVGEVASLFAQAGMLVISAFISPYREDRRRARAMSPELFHTVHINASLEVCESRDVKGLYKKAREGKIPDFTGVSAPYEIPANPELVIDSGTHSIDECIGQLMEYVEREFGLKSSGN